MKRFRLSTLILVVAIAALSIAFVVEHRRADRFEAAYLREIRAEAQMKEAQDNMAAAVKRVTDSINNANKK